MWESGLPVKQMPIRAKGFDSSHIHHCQALCIGIGELSLKQRAVGSTPTLATKFYD